MLKYVLLGSLNYQPMTGYEVKQFMDSSTAHFWHAKLSQIYVTLKALEQAGQVTSTAVPQDGRPDRRVYTITAEGVQELNTWLQDVTIKQAQPKEPFLLKLFFSGGIDKETLLTQLRLQHTLHQKLIEKYKSETADLISEVVEQAPHLKKDGLLWEATRRSGEIIEEAVLLWLSETIQMVEENF